MEEILRKIVKSDYHIAWLNTLSMLEHMGSRKIHACQFGPDISEFILKHAQEEARHAYYFKKQVRKLLEQAERTDVPGYRTEALLAPKSAVRYFQSLDAVVRRELIKAGKFSPKAAYALVTLTIEKRAMTIYPLYNKILKEENTGIRIDSIIAEEENHLRDISTIMHEENVQQFEGVVERFEEALFQRFMRNIGRVSAQVA